MNKKLNKAEELIIYSTVILLPVFFLPIFPNYFITSKLMLLVVASLAILIVKALRIFYTRKIILSLGKIEVTTALLVLSFILSAIYRTPNKIDAFFLPGTATIYLLGFILFISIIKFKASIKDNLVKILFLSAVLTSASTLFFKSGLLDLFIQTPSFLLSENFNTTGGNLEAIIFLVICIPIGLSLVISEKDMVNKFFWGVALTVLFFSLSILIFNQLNLAGKGDVRAKLAPFSTSWEVTFDSLKENPLLGIGSGNYITAFNQFRSISYNKTDSWNLKFTNARSHYLTIITETGLIGFASITLLVTSVFQIVNKNIKRRKDKQLINLSTSVNPAILSLSLLFLMLLISPAGLVVITTLFILLGINTKAQKHILNLAPDKKDSSKDMDIQDALSSNQIVTTLPSLVLIILALALAYFSGKFLLAEYKYKNALNALVKNDAKLTYDLMQDAIRINPRVDRYHASFSQVNFVLAQNWAQNAQQSGSDISNEDREKIAQLAQQSINEAKATVSLNPQRAGNWELLAKIYRSLTTLANGSDVFAIQSYSQAIALDPVNPELRISLGGLYYGRQGFDSAIEAFKLAVLTKPDHANAHYNLALAYRENGQIEKAIPEMTIVLSLVDRGSSDYRLAKTQLMDLESQKPTPSEEPAENLENLVPPPDVEEPIIDPRIDLPEEASPPTAIETEPTPTPSPIPSPTP